MARKNNAISTTQITMSTTPPVKRMLEELVTSGLYGKSAAEAAERLVTRELERLLREGPLRQMTKGA